ncbi:hypothetical protein BLSTO_04069 [Blastocystis sp. subtype 1]
MESDQCLQQLLDFISGGLQNPAECDPQLLLLLVLLEEVYETGNSIPLLTEKRDTIQKVISDGVCGIVQSVNAILQHAAELSEDTIRESLNILLILIPHNDLSRVLDVSVVECLFRFISDFNNPLSLDAMKCVNELLLKHLIPYSFRSVYCRIINTITSLMLAVAQDVDAISPEYTKQLILLVYELTVNYITAMLAQPDFDLVQYLAALLHSLPPLTHRVRFTQVQTAPRCYLQLMRVWSAVLDCVLQRGWSDHLHHASPVEDSVRADLPCLLQHLLGVLRLSANHPVVRDSDRSEEYLEEAGEASEGGEEAAAKEEVDELTGDFEETPAQILPVVTEYDHVLEKTFVVASKLLAVPEVRAACCEGVRRWACWAAVGARCRWRRRA